MRHRRSTPKLGVKTAHRKAMMSNMVTSLIDHGQIQTTVTRAKALVPVVSRLVTLAKRGDVHARRLAATTVRDKAVLRKLFGEVAGEFKDRNGGYTRVVKSGFRKGDGASLAIVQLIMEKKAEEPDKKKEKTTKKTAKTSAGKKEAKGSN
ncbi:MAG: 50S ribosomal protein L17 [candidate division Zixibacteria bacterium]|nr:50S ribosomal protein L17 [candidate division Zixibacteria bacterium]